MDYNEKERLRSEYVELLKKNNTRCFLTTTFNKDITCSQTLETGRALMKRLRKAYFKRNKQRAFLGGYVVIESQRLGRPHLHFLISEHPIFQSADKSFRETVNGKCRKLKLIDENVGVDIQDYYHHNLERYLTKSIEYEQDSFDFIKPLTYDGF
ncbi:MAG: hypothetical protein KAT93_08090 [Desulfuromonadales bacterium]|nr:hypothetical protein [Desulfuromonadales bacterium]